VGSHTFEAFKAGFLIPFVQMTVYKILAVVHNDDGCTFYELNVSEEALRMLKSHAEKTEGQCIFLDGADRVAVFGENDELLVDPVKLPYLPPSSDFAGMFEFGYVC
jgi:hypothetical protein